MLADEFSTIFREEHRDIRDALLDLIDAFQARDREAINTLLGRTAVLTGPHFRYEEESLYPALTEIFGSDYIEHLLADHDRAIGIAHRLIDIAGEDVLTDAKVKEAVQLIRQVLPHVSDCDGLSIMVERFQEEQVQSILDSRDASRSEDLDLIRWTQQIRPRSAVKVVEPAL
ncbi:MAG: hemerythrin domain-containing protein [Candidatus Latescibacteria bacterium]|jgi:hypothetical protein|nr:hemerythrin domain-containing protein [Candidatus Latescibacterota bacterium]